ncbi:MAG: hypothetical protein PF505_06415, partial [Vallitaleaceae bacterium]|nr:hypothetical protein [Vallitaleaceae bacterium]
MSTKEEPHQMSKSTTNTMQKVTNISYILLILCITILLTLLFTNSPLTDDLQDDIASAILEAADNAGITYSEEYFDVYNRDDEMIQLYYAIAFGYSVNDGDKLPIDVYHMDCGYNNNLTTIGIYRFESDEYAKAAYDSSIDVIQQSTSTESSVYPDMTEEEQAFAEAVDVFLSSWKIDMTSSTFHGEEALLSHSYYGYTFGNVEGDQILEDMYGNIHGHSFTWTQGNFLISISYTNDNTSSSDLTNMAEYFYSSLAAYQNIPDADVIIEPETVDPDMAVSTSANYCKDLGDEITITVKLTNEVNEPPSGEIVTLENSDDGSIVTGLVGDDGRVSFTVIHDNEDNEIYHFKVIGMAMSKSLEFPV